MTQPLRDALHRLDQPVTATTTPAPAPGPAPPRTPRPDPSQGARQHLTATDAHRDALANGDIRAAIKLNQQQHNVRQRL